MFPRLNHRFIQRYLRPSDDAVLRNNYVALKPESATVLGQGGNIKRLKAGTTYIIRVAGAVSPARIVAQVVPNPKLTAAGFVSVSPEFYTPEGGEGPVTILFNCCKDISLEDLDYAVRVYTDGAICSPWI